MKPYKVKTMTGVWEYSSEFWALRRFLNWNSIKDGFAFLYHDERCIVQKDRVVGYRVLGRRGLTSFDTMMKKDRRTFWIFMKGRKHGRVTYLVRRVSVRLNKDEIE